MVDPPTRGRAVVGGIYALTSATDTCCWVQRESTFSVLKDEPATDLAVQLYFPNLGRFRLPPQRIEVVLDGKWHFVKCCYTAGNHTLLLPLPRDLRSRNGPVRVAMTMGEDFVAAKLGIGTDTRPLAAVLVDVEFRTY